MAERTLVILKPPREENTQDPNSESAQKHTYRGMVSRSGWPGAFTSEDLGTRRTRCYAIITQDNEVKRIIRTPFMYEFLGSEVTDALSEVLEMVMGDYPIPEYDLLVGSGMCLQELEDGNPFIKFPPTVHIEDVAIKRVA